MVNRYILKEIALPFFMILFVLTLVLLLGKILQLIDLMINKGIRFTDISQLILFLMPSFLMFTIPISLLIAILIGLGRLSGDNEITILKMSGVSLYQLAYPVTFAALSAFLLTGITTLFLVPYGNVASKNLLFDMAKQKASIGIQEKVFIDDFRGILLYAESIPVHGDFLEGVLVSDNRISKEPSTIIARKAYLISDPDTLAITLRLEDGTTHTVDAGLKNYRKMDFHFYDVRLDLSESLSEGKKSGTKSSTDMTLTELSAMLKSQGIKDDALREIEIELYKKLTIPLTCLLFALIALPLGIRAHRSVRSRGFAIGLAIVLVYYLLRLSGEALVETGRLSPIIGTWVPSGIFAGTGLLLFFLAARELSLRVRFSALPPDHGAPPGPFKSSFSEAGVADPAMEMKSPGTSDLRAAGRGPRSFLFTPRPKKDRPKAKRST
ncbi:MAG: LPS export ABC transporter permease LptF [Syntrophales bacterium]|nr:LPS export ABC transporter permease LptF [Syntrophales bacterium]